MAREQRRLLISPERLRRLERSAADQPLLPLERDELHYLQRVLRLRTGDGFAVIDGVGHRWQAQLAVSEARLMTPLAQPAESRPAPAPRLQLAVALPRRDSEVLLRMTTELGIDGLQPLLAERSVVERWNRQRAAGIVREAVEQCERLWCPDLGDPMVAATWLAQATGLRLLATTRRNDALPLAQALAAHAAGAGEAEPVCVAVGPEGGWSGAEEEQAIAAGWLPVSLAATILRCSTAAVAAAVALVSWRD